MHFSYSPTLSTANLRSKHTHLASCIYNFFLFLCSLMSQLQLLQFISAAIPAQSLSPTLKQQPVIFVRIEMEIVCVYVFAG